MAHGIRRSAPHGQRSAALLVAACCAATLLTTTSPASADGVVITVSRSPGGVRWAPAGVEAGGHETVVVPSPRHPGLWLAGSDVTGVFRSVDGGSTWESAAAGFENDFAQNVGAISWDPFDPDVAYACAAKDVDGTRPVEAWQGYFYRSSDGGKTFVPTSDQAWCTGANTLGTGLPSPFPRSTGRLIVADPVRQGRIWVGSTLDGVFLSEDGGRTFTTRGLAGQHIRGLAIDPANPNVVYAAVREGSVVYGIGGVYKTINGGFDWTRLNGSPSTPEELALVGQTLWVGAGPAGVWQGAKGGKTWRNRSGGLPLDGKVDVISLTAVPTKAAQPVLYAGLDNDVPCASGASCSHLYRSTNGGTSWTPMATGASVHTTIADATGPVWRQAADGRTMLDQSSSVVTDIAVDPFAPATLMVAGRTGPWRTVDGGANWYPVPRGITVTFHPDVAADPGAPGRVVSATTDWQYEETPDDGFSITDQRLGGNARAVAVLDDPTIVGARPVYAGLESGARAGEVLVKETPGGSFTPTGLAALTSNKRVEAVAARTIGGQRVVLALVLGGGLWKKTGDQAWHRVITKAGPSYLGGPWPVSIDWTSDPNVVFLGDGEQGTAWRSTNAGETWQQIAAVPNGLATDPALPSRLYVVRDGRLDRFDNALTGSLINGTLVPTVSTPIADATMVDVAPDGRVIVMASDVGGVLGSSASTRARVYRSADGGVSFTEITDRAFSGGVLDPIALTVTPSGSIHVGTKGTGWWIGRADFVSGGTGTIDVDAENRSTAASGPIAVDVPLDAGQGFASYTGIGWACTPTGASVHCDHGALRGREAASRLSIVVSVA